MAGKVDSGTQKRRKPAKKHRSARTGRYVPKAAAKASPATTVAETDGEAARLRAAIRKAVKLLVADQCREVNADWVECCEALVILRAALRKPRRAKA